MTPSNAVSLGNTSFWNRFLNFDEFITGGLLKIVYIIGVALVLLVTVGGGGFTALGLIALNSNSLGAAMGALFFFILSLVGGGLGLLLWRVYCELIMVIFKINENLQALRDENKLR